MFEKNVIDVSENIFGGVRDKTFVVLTHKKHKREIYLERGNKEALKYIILKMKSFKKRLVYYSLSLGVLQPFLKKVKLNSNIGDVIFCGNQIKAFNLKKRFVCSFPLTESKDTFIKSKINQQIISLKGFAPKIRVNEPRGYSIDELVEDYEGTDEDAFKRILEFYQVKKVLFEGKEYLITKIHGDFAKENIMIKNGKIMFVDWNLREGLITSDLVNFFRSENNLMKNERFLKLLKLYSIEVQENIEEYIKNDKIYKNERRYDKK